MFFPASFPSRSASFGVGGELIFGGELILLSVLSRQKRISRSEQQRVIVEGEVN
jgi:hypothetical protein